MLPDETVYKPKEKESKTHLKRLEILWKINSLLVDRKVWRSRYTKEFKYPFVAKKYNLFERGKTRMEQNAPE